MVHYKLKRKVPETVEAKQVFMSGTIDIPEDSFVDGNLVSTSRFLPFSYGDYIIKTKKGFKFPMTKEVFEFLYEVKQNDS